MNLSEDSQPSAPDFLSGGGKMGALMRAHTWGATPLGRPEGWPQPLKTLLSVMLGSNQPMFVAWGPQRTLLYNDSYAAILGLKHPKALGHDFLEVWHEIRADLLPIVEEGYAGRPVHMGDIKLIVERRGYPEETHFAFSYTPVRDETGAVAGFFCPCIETTEHVFAERRRAFRLLLEERLRNVVDPGEITQTAVALLGEHLSADRVGYSEIVDDRIVRTAGSYAANGVRPLKGEFPIDRFGEGLTARQRQGITIVSDDVLADPDRADEVWAAINTRSVISVPLVRDGRLLASLYVSNRKPRRWLADDMAVVEEVAARTWDAVERARAEARLRESEAQFRLTADAVPQIVWITDAEGGVQFFNKQWFDYIGATQTLPTADAVAESYVHPDDQAVTKAAFEEARRTGSTYLVEHRIRSAAGEYRWFLVRGEPQRDPETGNILRWFGASVDINDRRQAEEALRESEGRFREAADAAPVLIWMSDTSKSCTWFNRPWLEFTGRTMAQEYGFGWAEGVHPEDYDRCVAIYSEAFARREPFRMDYRLRRHDGEWRVIDDSGIPRFADDGAFLGYIGACTDVTESHRAEQEVRKLNETLEKRVAQRSAELEQAQEALRQSQKLEAMGQLTGGVAHDFNNLLTPIIASLDMLTRRGVGNEREQRLIDGALQSAERAKTLVQRLLAFARRQPLQPTAVDLARLVGGMAELVASTSGPKVNVRVELPDDLPPAIADANQLEMAILNLAVNARDAMPDGGILTISAARESVRPGDNSKLRQGHYARLSVQDTGTGMDQVTLTRAIEPFFSTKGIGKGTGLGLSMVHGLAAQLDGGLTITSSPGEGATIDLWLPISPLAAEDTDQAPGTTQEPIGLGTALLVDDEVLVRMSTADMLMDLGYEVVEAGSAEEALRLVEGGLSPNLLVTDHLMPGITGFDLSQALRSRLPDLPVLIVSGYAEGDGVAPDLPQLTKPFRQADLAAKLSELDERRQRRESASGACS